VVVFFFVEYKRLEAEARGACRGARVSGGDLCEAEAPTEPAGETKSFCPCHSSPETVDIQGFRDFSFRKIIFSNTFDPFF
jgi:hypothetical protein